MEINGLPLHPLLVHAVVVFVPLAAVLGLAFAALPRWRGLLRWPTAGGAVVALVLTQVAVMSGRNLQETRNLRSELIDTHEEWGLRLRIAVIVFAVVAIAAAWLIRTDLPEGQGGATTALVVPVAAVLVLSALAVLTLAFIAGEAGARAVWGS